MDSRHLVDPELLPFIDSFPSLAVSLETLHALRAGFAVNQVEIPEEGPDPVNVTRAESKCPGPTGAPDLRFLLYTPTKPGDPKPAILHLHGGGYVVGSPDYANAHNWRMADKLDCVVASVDYRLAPETPHPGPVEDCYAMLSWLHKNAARLGIDPNRIGVMGESAGGGLAAALALLARDRGEFPLAFQCLIYPMLDDRTCTSSTLSAWTGQYVWTRETNRFGWTALLNRDPGGEGIDCYAAAARATDLSNLPPAFIAVGTVDLFVDENIAYAKRLIDAGVPTELHVYPGAVHGFIMDANATVRHALCRDYEAALKRIFSSTPGPSAKTAK